ncbi:signal peptide peptidase SppA [Thermomonas carbonis]|uniref:Signal peptide peptidase SppA n=1 Tax=Thermomonas carbonis TaxID=1463158 RepID=A0A7G9STF2_9GAMM|nr:signal peptide peptidase SppA [Thermomonas carbonis]QNN71127.1 signal peptide peptidase SppA [Thermomonas carbonis]GHC11799.1 protease [Thermomonas carbonis]
MNEPRRRGPIARIAIGLWDTVNFTRRLVFNLLFLALLVLVLAMMFGGGKLAPLSERSTLVIAPEGRLVEQFSCDALSRNIARATNSNDCREVRLRDLLRALDAARTDTRIERVVLHLDDLQPSGFASMRDVAAAIAKVKAAKKQVVAYGDNYSQGQYLLAAQANEIYLDPMSQGGVMLEGLASYRQYFREALQDKLGVDMHLFKVGEYKSAAEPYILDAASPESKEADLFWMNDLWQRMLADAGKARGIAPAALAAQADALAEQVKAVNGDLAQLALNQKLVDGLKTREQVEDLLVERGVADDGAAGGFRQVALDTYLQHLDGALPQADARPQVAVVVAEGGIAGGELPPGQVGGESTAALLRDARDDDNVKAVVLRVNSPGGEVFASEQIRREVAAIKAAGKPVVVSMGDVAASGGYWISMNADRIYADPSTITGSIGIFGLFPTIDRSLDKIGVHTDGVSTAKYAGAFDITRPLDPGVATTVQAVIEKGYRDFTGKVAQARGRSVEQIDEVARGRVWSGAQAKERGLVDVLGGLDAALADAAARAKLGKPDAWQARYIEDSATPLSQWFGGMLQSRAGLSLLQASGIGELVLARQLQAQAPLRFIENALRNRGNVRVTPLAYCFCTVQ